MEKRGLAVCISNAAVFLQYGKIKFLIDGLYLDQSGCFSAIPEKILEDMLQGKGELRNIEYLLFTHAHSDHFYSPYLERYLEHNQIKGLCLPPAEQSPAFLGENARKFAVPFDETGKAILTDEVSLGYLDVRHLDQKFYHVVNRCFWIQAGEKLLLFLGDADYQEDAFLPMAERNVDIVFVTPVFYNHEKGRRILREIIKPWKIVLYHLPFPADDRMRFGNMVKRDAERYAEKGQAISIWNKTGQSFLF